MKAHGVSNGALGWCGIAVFVLIYDSWALASERETLSSAFRQNASHPGWRWLVLPLWLVTSLHLFGRIPRQCDPFVGYGALVSRLKPWSRSSS